MIMLTNKEAIQILSTRDKYGVPCGYTSGYQEALDMAIEALNQTKQIGCTGCEHYDQQQTALICRDCKRYYKDMYEDGEA